jgi:hypothetical protein
VTARVMLPRVFTRGNIRGGRVPACWEAPGPRCSITPRTSHVPAGPAAHVTAASDMPGGAERRSFGELQERDGGCSITFQGHLRQTMSYPCQEKRDYENPVFGKAMKSI